MKLITSESVNIGHPDKTCDVIADAILDEALRQDPDAQMAIECAIKNDKLFIYGEATTRGNIDYDRIAKGVLRDVGYTCDFQIIKEISEQSVDISSAVHQDKISAGDQGIMYGYATDETPEYMPTPIIMAHDLMREYEQFRKLHKGYHSDAKSQVTIVYDEEKPIAIDTIVISASHDNCIELDKLRATIKKEVIEKVLHKYNYLDASNTRYLVNPGGKFTIWGSFGDSGCVGRKIVVDTYGGVGRVGGGCFSSKNATKVDRSGAYYARYVAKNIVAHKLAHKCEIQVSYAIGVDEAISIYIDTFGTNLVDMPAIYKYVGNNFNFNLGNIINTLHLNRPIYKDTACYGHFGREQFSWESIVN